MLREIKFNLILFFKEILPDSSFKLFTRQSPNKERNGIICFNGADNEAVPSFAVSRLKFAFNMFLVTRPSISVMTQVDEFIKTSRCFC